MPTVEESVCCQVIVELQQKCTDENVHCITDHPGFEPVCLNEHVLQTAYHQYRCQYKPLEQKSVQE